jgi:ABC-type multidrug transport system fused ATPase/permease subunit
MADRIMVVDRGRIAECGRPQDLIRANGIYARLCRVSEGQAPGLLLDEVFSELQSA